MRVKLVQQMSGLRNGEPWPDIGEVMDLPDDEANAMLATGGAVKPDQAHAIDAVAAARRAADRNNAEVQQDAVDKAKADADAAVARAEAVQRNVEAQNAGEPRNEDARSGADRAPVQETAEPQAVVNPKAPDAGKPVVKKAGA